MAAPPLDIRIQLGRALLAAGAGGFGLACLIFSTTVQGLETLPKAMPAQTAVAWISGMLLLAGGLGLFAGRWAWTAALGLAGLFLLWVAAIHLPLLIAHPGSMIEWVIATETLALAAGAMALAGPLAGEWTISPWVARAARAAPYVFAANLPVFALSHAVYIDYVAGDVPAWIPLPVFWAWFTAFGHLAAGVAILSGVQARLGATLLGVMYAIIMLSVHLPDVLARPYGRSEWTNLLLDMAITGAAFVVAGVVKDRILFRRGTATAPAA